MTDRTDIVTRLRGHIAITTRIHYAKDGYPEPVYVHGPSSICQEAADELERLRAELVSTTNRLTAERDEARQDFCYCDDGWPLSDEQARQRASQLGWDCFSKDADNK